VRQEVDMNMNERNEKLAMVIDNPRLNEADRKAEFDRLLGPSPEDVRRHRQTVLPYREEGYVLAADSDCATVYVVRTEEAHATLSYSMRHPAAGDDLAPANVVRFQTCGPAMWEWYTTTEVVARTCGPIRFWHGE